MQIKSHQGQLVGADGMPMLEFGDGIEFGIRNQIEEGAGAAFGAEAGQTCVLFVLRAALLFDLADSSTGAVILPFGPASRFGR